MRGLIFLLGAAALCFAADPLPVIRHANADPETIIQLNVSPFEYSSIVLPEGEKAVSYLCGDPKHYDVQVIEGAERYVNIKPTPGAHETDLQILTDHNHNYTVKASIQTPVDAKLFLDSNDVEAIRKPPTFVPAAEALQTKVALEQARAELARVKKDADTQVRSEEDKYKAQYPQKLAFDYSFQRDEAPFHIHAVFHDDHQTYIAASPDEVASLYALRDGKPDLVQFQYNNGVYVVQSVLDRGFLQVGKRKTDITRKGQ